MLLYVRREVVELLVLEHLVTFTLLSDRWSHLLVEFKSDFILLVLAGHRVHTSTTLEPLVP